MPKRTHILVRQWMCATIIILLFPSSGWAADWTVQKASGQVWIVSAKAQRVALGKETALLPGDSLQTGPNGRVLLVRDEETILVGPNTVIALPDEPSQVAMTTILQQAGSIAVKAEKREGKHFVVQTPYLAAVVKGTEFVVTLEPEVADVQVISGEVEVAHFKSGQIASIRQGQAARIQGDLGLILRGTGVFSLIRNSGPVKAIIHLVNIPKKGLRAPLRKSGQVVRTLTVKLGRSLNGAKRAAGMVPTIFGNLPFLKPQMHRRR